MNLKHLPSTHVVPAPCHYHHRFGQGDEMRMKHRPEASPSADETLHDVVPPGRVRAVRAAAKAAVPSLADARWIKNKSPPALFPSTVMSSRFGRKLLDDLRQIAIAICAFFLHRSLVGHVCRFQDVNQQVCNLPADSSAMFGKPMPPRKRPRAALGL
ncbi:uncharacterized protein LOC119311644 [Triticum dicoccoides]|uniref:uncharacterized protein LOC119311644 n=1 Tax=Triticum dicoccoides TaxID=85692 RepID=UPI00188F1002|nr:uncharacterized protein LOC119311644 [Triticum dicoccoides]XP_044376470.1 uncharacterized protein LOC123098506 [Triticum aestivum]